MHIQIGDTIPNVTLKQITPDGFQDVELHSLVKGKTVAIFAIPGAFTPTCTLIHLPGFSKRMVDFTAKNIQVMCVAVNDPFVMTAWSKATNTPQNLILLSDWNAAFTKAIGLDFDGSIAGLGIRSQRYSMLLKDGVVASLDIEQNPGECDVSSADHLLKNA